RTAIFVHDEEQRRLAEASKEALEESGRFDQPIVTAIEDAGPFYAAEEYHQDYYEKNPLQYKFYRWNCGRDARLAELWGDQPTHGAGGRGSGEYCRTTRDRFCSWRRRPHECSAPAHPELTDARGAT